MPIPAVAGMGLMGSGYPGNPMNPQVVTENISKVFIGGLPTDMPEQEIKDLISEHGELKSFHLVTVGGVSKGYAFCEFAEPDVTDRACDSLSGLKIGEHTILAQRANAGAIAGMQPLQNLNVYSSTNVLNLGIPVQTLIENLDGAVPIQPTRVLQLLNIVTPRDLLDDDEYALILKEVESECQKYGSVLSITIPRPTPPEDLDEDENEKKNEGCRALALPNIGLGNNKQLAILGEKMPPLPLMPVLGPPPLPPHLSLNPKTLEPGVGRIFVEFETAKEAIKAQQAIAGRRYHYHIVFTSYYPEDLYEKRDFTKH